MSTDDLVWNINDISAIIMTVVCGEEEDMLQEVSQRTLFSSLLTVFHGNRIHNGRFLINIGG